MSSPEITQFIYARFQQIIAGTNTSLAFPEDWDFQTLIEYNRVALVLAEAYKNQGMYQMALTAVINTDINKKKVCTSWSVENYCQDLQKKCSGTNIKVEEAMRKKFPPVHTEMELYTTPMMVTDVNGNILVWYLPGILEPRMQVSAFQITIIPAVYWGG